MSTKYSTLILATWVFLTCGFNVREVGGSPIESRDVGNLMNVIVFEALDDKRTRVESYGVGYRDLPEYDDLMEFFIPANQGLFLKLKEHLEG